jgi:hypothetical protein
MRKTIEQTAKAQRDHASYQGFAEESIHRQPHAASATEG